VGTVGRSQQQTQGQEHQATSSEALIAFVRLLARRAAHEAFVSAQPAVASKLDHSEPEDNHEAED